MKLSMYAVMQDHFMHYNTESVTVFECSNYQKDLNMERHNITVRKDERIRNDDDAEN